jgi:hypothetical protein
MSLEWSFVIGAVLMFYVYILIYWLWGQLYYLSPFSNEETEAPKGQISCKGYADDK